VLKDKKVINRDSLRSQIVYRMIWIIKQIGINKIKTVVRHNREYRDCNKNKPIYKKIRKTNPVLHKIN
jgi:hypothetical protein